jgi:hypothetical protein
MKRGVAVMFIAGALLLSGSGSTFAAGKLGGTSGMDVVGSARPELAGKMGGAAGGFEVEGPTAPLFAGKLGGAGGADEFLYSVTETLTVLQASFAARTGGLAGGVGGIVIGEEIPT